MAVATVAVIGAGQAGLQVAATLREQGYAGGVVLIGDEPHAPYQRPPLSKGYLLGEVSATQVSLRPPAFFGKQRIQLVTGKRAVAIERALRLVRLDDDAVVAYDQLVLATGARNRPLLVPGADLRNVCFLRTLNEAEVLRVQLTAAKNAVVIGAGFIGLEFAAAAVQQGVCVTVLDIATRPMARAVSATMSGIMAREHAQLGVRMRLETQVLRLLGRDGCVTAVETVDGEVLPADLMVIGIGVIPNVELAASCDLAVEDGIVVDEFLQTSDPNISAIGDVVAHPNPYAHSRRVRLESVQNAADQARCVAQHILGQAVAYNAVPWFWSHQGNLKLQMAGLPNVGCQEVVRGDATTSACSVFLFHEHRLVCVESLNRMEKASLVGLVDHLRKFPGEVSGGMKKRAGLARALAMDPEIVFFDEPDSGLDPVRVAYLDELVRKIQEETHATFIIITHNIPSVMRTADYIAVLFRSGLVRFSSTQDMITCDDEIIRQFMAGKAGGPIGMDELATERTDVELELIERASARAEERKQQARLEAEHEVMQV